MLIKILISYLIGYVRIEITGFYIERFLNLCNSKKILTWNLKKGKDANIFLNVRIKDFKKIVKLFKKVKCKIKIKGKRGIPFLLYRYKKRKILIFFILLIIITTIISSYFIWNIDIIEENEEILENIYSDIEEAGIKVGGLKSGIDTKEIINRIRLKRKDIAWIGIELKGTNAIVKVVKAKEKPEIINNEDYCNIISDKEGVITKINAQNGTAQVKIGDTINKGSILIGGWMEGKYTGVRYVHAKGEIEAKVWYTKHKTKQLNTTETINTKNEEKKYSIKINNFKINLWKKLSKFEFYDTIETEHKIHIFSDFYLPISLIEIKNIEQKKEEKTYTFEEAKELGVQELEEEILNEIGENKNIVNKHINTYKNGNDIEIYVTYEVVENIGINKKIVF